MGQALTRRGFLALVAAAGAVALGGCNRNAASLSSQGLAPDEITESTLLSDIVDHPLLEGYGRFLFPITMDVPGPDDRIADVPDLLPWYHDVQSSDTIAVIQDILERREAGQTVFCEICSDEEKAADPSLEDTGLYYFPAQWLGPGEKAPVAFLCAGGGFAYVGSIHDSMPHALWLSQQGVNAFTLQYRLGLDAAAADLARAVSYVNAHADDFNADLSGYSLWGGSAGARVAAAVGGQGPAGYGGDDLPQPAAVVTEYSSCGTVADHEPDTYAVVGSDDGIVSWQAMEQRIDAIAMQGTPTEFHVFDGLPHGFGLGRGTEAEGWIEGALDFWMRARYGRRLSMERELSRRSFLAGSLLAGGLVLTACTQETTGGADADGAQPQASGDGGSDASGGEDAVRELVEPDGQPSQSGMEQGHVSPDPATVEGTVLDATVDSARTQTFFLWEEGNVPTVTDVSGLSGSDPAGFRPSLTFYPKAADADCKGAVLLCSGGAFQIRSDNAEGGPSAKRFSEFGYQAFVVDYRIRPYTQQEGGVDLARAIRFVRQHAEDYELPSPDAIAVGFSAGGIQAGETLLNWKGHVSPSALDASYVPDALDDASADAASCAMIYSFYGRLSVAEKDGSILAAGELPPTYYCYGTEDPFYDQFEGQVELMDELGYQVHARVIDGWPHGFGPEGGWIEEFDRFFQQALGIN